VNILGTQYTLKHKAFEIYMAGCNGSPHCKGCHNPESWDFNQGEVINETYLSALKNKIQSFEELIDNIMIFGGEPLDQKMIDLVDLLEWLSQFNKKIWIFTRYNLDEVPVIIKDRCDYLKCGRYEPEKLTDNNTQYGIMLATSNQHIYKKGLDY
jgi:anaerobic ribonucleoside-triphosphate reductase activating protein